VRWLSLFVVAACGTGPQRMTKAASAVYVRTDTDRTTIVTPKVELAADVSASTSVEVGYEIDAWTGASVDVITAATGAITEVRNEVDAAVAHQRGDVKLSLGYRFSTEPDYTSHGVVLGSRLELARNNTTLGLDLLGSSDTVGRAGDPLFEQGLWSAGVRGSIAQVIDSKTIAELVWETTRLDGFQGSPYRFVAIGGDGTCASSAPFCISEQVPEVRYRNAAFLRARRALTETVSAGLEGRFYFDTWGVRSFVVQPDVAWQPTKAAVLALRYRYYTQGEASFYRPRYFDVMGVAGYATRDRKLSAFFTHELGASYLHRFTLCGDRVLVGGARVGGSRIEYQAFVGLERVWALELTALLGLELP